MKTKKLIETTHQFSQTVRTRLKVMQDKPIRDLVMERIHDVLFMELEQKRGFEVVVNTEDKPDMRLLNVFATKNGLTVDSQTCIDMTATTEYDPPVNLTVRQANEQGYLVNFLWVTSLYAGIDDFGEHICREIEETWIELSTT
jgi:hypothetical protein